MTNPLSQILIFFFYFMFLFNTFMFLTYVYNLLKISFLQILFFIFFFNYSRFLILKMFKKFYDFIFIIPEYLYTMSNNLYWSVSCFIDIFYEWFYPIISPCPILSTSFNYKMMYLKAGDTPR